MHADGKSALASVSKWNSGKVNSKLNIWKCQKISSGKALYFRSYQPKTSRGVENTPPPSAFRVNIIRQSLVKKDVQLFLRPERNELPAGGSGGAGKPQRVQGGVLVRVQGAKPPKAPRIPHFRTSDMLLSWRKNLVFLLNKNI